MLGFDVVEDVADRASLGKMTELDGQVLLQRLMSAFGLALQRSVDVVGDVADQDIRHAYMLLALAGHDKVPTVAAADRAAGPIQAGWGLQGMGGPGYDYWSRPLVALSTVTAPSRPTKS